MHMAETFLLIQKTIFFIDFLLGSEIAESVQSIIDKNPLDIHYGQSN